MEERFLDIYSDLSTYEQIELFYTVSGNVTENITVLITTLFAYLALAYIAGKDLSRFQVYSISTIYSVFIFFMVGGISRDSATVSDIAFSLFQIDSSNDGLILTIVLLLGWLLSLIFMVQTRRAKDT